MTREELKIEYAEELKDCFDFSPSRGWTKLIGKLLADIRVLNIKDLSIVQVKSKFCGLRFYTHNHDNEELSKLIKEAERKSLFTCESCGATAGDGMPKSGINICEKCTEAKDWNHD